MSIDRNKIKKIIGVSASVLGAAFVSMSILAKKKKTASIYEDDKEQKNPFEGKKVVLIEDENDKENADGVKGHLEATGDSDYNPGFYERRIKRVIDVALSFGGLVVLSPVFGAIALAIKIEDPGPVLFIQKRIGQNKRYFKLHKFRSMKMSTPHDVPTHQLENPEQYITKVGKFLRAHSLDELPQIWDIFVGNMSVIGPRPGLWNQDLLTAERDKYGANDVKPGLTGWAQINGRDELEIHDKAKLDGEYVKKMGLGMDIKCFLGSVHVIGKDDSVVEGGIGEMKKKSIGRHYTDGKSDGELIGHIGFGEPVQIDKGGYKRVLITGAGSYIGESFRTYAAEHYPDNFLIDAVDMIDPTWKDMDFSSYDIVYHVAGLAHADIGNVDETTKEKYYSINTDLAFEVCKKAKAEGVKEFVFMSSMIVYGDSAPYGKKKVVDEHTVPVAVNFYGDSKLQADVAVRSFAEDKFKVIVLRPPMIYGKGSKGNYPTLAKLAKKLPIFPNLDNERSMLHIDNLCEFLCQIMLVKEIKKNAVVLIPQNGEYTRTSEIVKEICDVIDSRIFITKLLNPVVKILGKIPGKISKVVNKAFGNNCYYMPISDYEGINYRVKNLRESIVDTERTSTILSQFLEYKTNDKKINFFIIGLRGYTQNYGGWEAFAHGLLDNWSKTGDKDVQFWAFERVDSYDKEEIVVVNNVICVRVCELEQGSSAMMKYDKHCTDLTCEYVKTNNPINPIMFHLGVRIGPYLLIKRNYIKSLGIMMAENPAGAEWRRTKWNRFVQVYLYISAMMMAKSTDCMVCDNEGIRDLYCKLLHGRKPDLEYVAYGVEKIGPVEDKVPQKVIDYFNQWGIEKDQYYVILGRFIPENNYEMMFKGFMKSNTNRKLLVICNYKTEIQKFYEHIIKSTGFMNDERVIMAGTLYDKEILHYVRQYARGYIHGHSVGGTNPGLLEAMEETNVNILYDVDFNKYVGKESALYFDSEDCLAKIIDMVDSMQENERITLGMKAKTRMDEFYSWKYICEEYNRVIHKIVNDIK